jgi:hypothetical protein
MTVTASQRTTEGVSFRASSAYPGSVPAELIVAEKGIRPAGCDVCTWGYQRGQLVLKYVHANCALHRDAPLKGRS